MDDKQEEWIPLRQAVSEVAEAYAKFMHCEPKDATKDALHAIIRYLSREQMIGRSATWLILYPEGKENRGKRGVVSKVDPELWMLVKNAMAGAFEVNLLGSGLTTATR